MPARRLGYTLLELLTVLSIIAILAAMALPRLRLERLQVDSAARTVATVLLAARADAVSRGHDVLVVFDTTRGLVRTVWDANNNRRLDGGEKTRPVLLPERVVIGRGAGVPAFNGAVSATPSLQQLDGLPMLVVQHNGALDRGGVVYLTSRRGRDGLGDVDARALRLDRATGRATVFRHNRTGWTLQ